MDEKQFEKVGNPEVSPAEENVSAPDCSEETAEVLLEEEDAAKEIEKLKQELAREKAQSNEHYTRLIRAQADFDNFRKRNQKEKDEFWKYASEPLISELLPVLDNFGRALDATPGDGEKFLEGIQMIYRQLYEVLENEGLEVIDAKGEEFDPNKHEAVMQEETDEYPDNTVIEEMQRGYMFKDKIIRPAMVKVARSS
ncbi:MAG: nucleotide exchange factor GrpE [Firmicutes bacterium]|nr:nucleotide exchange factor GrpE [Bacillota bacterium]